jgi:ABC-type multidrug transport system fused ATPase/permease subunit
MKTLPVPDPGEPDARSAGHFLVWMARVHTGTLVVAMCFGIAWMVCQALMPALIGQSVDAIAEGNTGRVGWLAAGLFGLGVGQAYFGIMRHRFAVTNWLSAAYQTMQVTARQATRLGATLPKRLAAGEVVAIGTSDISGIGHSMDILARGAGAVVAIVVITVLLLRVSVPLGLLVVVGVTALVVTVGLLLRPLHRRQQAHRDLTGQLTGRAADIVAGLRILRGVGGEAAFAQRYRSRSQGVRAAGVRVAKVEAALEAAQVLLPGAFLVLVIWLGARFTLDGRITAGQLVSFYAYAAFLVVPLRALTEAADKITRGHVASRRVVRLLRLTPEITDPPSPVRDVPVSGNLVDPDSGVVVRPGQVTAIAAARPDDAVTIVDRLSRFDPASQARLSGVPLHDMRVSEVRSKIVVADNDALLFRGRLRDVLGLGCSDEAIAAALRVAAAEDIVEALPDGLDTVIAERGRDFSGGQQQRLRLVRALLVDPPILLLVEPTSAVDAHTEARIASRMAAARAGRTTVVCTTSPLLLDRADIVLYVEDGRLLAEGTHAELLDRVPAYAATVTRGEEG